MRQADTLTKEYLSNNEIFADVFNYLTQTSHTN